MLAGLLFGRLIEAAAVRSALVHGGRQVLARSAIQLMCVAAFAAVGVRTGLSWQLVPYLILMVTLVSASVIDWSQERIPNRLTKPAFALSLVSLTLLSLLDGTGSLSQALLGSITFSGLLGAIHLARPDGMGLGDVRLAAVLGLFIGFASLDWFDTGWRLGVTLLLASILGLLSTVALQASQGSWSRPLPGTRVPFGPALSMATAIIVLGPTLSAG